MPSPSYRRFSSKRRPTDGATHAAQFTSAVVHFTITAQVLGHLDIVRGARRLLNSGLATSAAWPSEQSVRVPDRLRKLSRSMRRTRSLYEHYLRASQAGTWRSGLAFTLRHPRLGVLHLRELWGARVAADFQKMQASLSARALLTFLVSHPFVGTVHVLPNVRFHRGKGGDKEQPEIPAQSADGAGGGTSSLQTDNSDDQEDLMQPLIEAERIVMEQQLVSAAERGIDALTFGGHDRDNDRFVRVLLRNSYHEFQVPGREVVQEVTFEPRLLLHASGAVQLSLQIASDGPLSTDQILDLMWGAGPLLVRSKMSLPMLTGSGWEPLVTGFEDELDAGQPLALVEHKGPASMAEALSAHLDAVMRVVRRSCGSWTIFPTTLTEPGECCEPAQWRVNHEQDVRRLAIRARGIAEIAGHVSPQRDLSVPADHSLFVNIGSATHIQWSGRRPTGIEELHTVLVLEYALLMYMRLQTVESAVPHVKLTNRRLQEVYRDAIALFSELRQGSVRSGEARDIVSHVLAQLGAERMRATIEAALTMAGMAYDTETASRAARRSWWVALVATAIAVLVAVAPIRDLLNAVGEQEVGDIPAWLMSPLTWAIARGFWAPWVIIACLLGGVFMLMFFGWALRRRPRHLPSFRRGFAWPTPIYFKAEDDQHPDSET